MFPELWHEQSRACAIAMNVLLVRRSVLALLALVALCCCHLHSTDNAINIPVGDPHGPHGVWRTRTVWKARWLKEWKQEKVWKPLWKKVWGPVEIKEWVPIPKPPPRWESEHE